MKHAILGAGAIGGLMATVLGYIGEDVALMARLPPLVTTVKKKVVPATMVVLLVLVLLVLLVLAGQGSGTWSSMRDAPPGWVGGGAWTGSTSWRSSWPTHRRLSGPWNSAPMPRFCVLRLSRPAPMLIG